MKQVTLLSPAKLNLYLKVLSKRPDGYHNIVTLFERVNLFDTIQFSLNRTKDIRISCSYPSVPLGPKNLVYRAAQKLKEDFDIQEGVTVRIHKRIPVAAGLAGGSSNAATALLGLNKLWQLHLSKKQLLSYARFLGSDVAFFLHNCSWGLGTQRGDVIRPVSIHQKLWHVVVVPKVKLYSAAIYGALKLKLTKRSDNVNILIHHLRKKNFNQAGCLLHNDLETAIVKIYPAIVQLKQKLKALKTQGVMISGSGPAVVGLTPSRKVAQQIHKTLSRRYGRVFVVRTF